MMNLQQRSRTFAASRTRINQILRRSLKTFFFLFFKFFGQKPTSDLQQLHCCLFKSGKRHRKKQLDCFSLTVPRLQLRLIKEQPLGGFSIDRVMLLAVVSMLHCVCVCVGFMWRSGSVTLIKKAWPF